MQASSTDRPFTTKKEFYAQFKKKSIAQELWLRFLKNKTAVIGLIIFCVVSCIHFFDSWLIDSEGSCSSEMAIRCGVVNALVNTGIS